MSSELWEEKLAIGEAGEKVLDEFFSSRYADIVPATEKWQMRGVDRWFVKDGYWTAVEYKTDFSAARTGNAFLEIIQNTEKNSPGWARKTCADIVYYYVPPTGMVYPLLPVMWKLEGKDGLEEGWKQARCKLHGNYESVGALVPLDSSNVVYGNGYSFIVKVFKDEGELLKWNG